MIDLGDKNKSEIDYKFKTANKIEMGSLGQNIDNLNGLYVISNQTNKNKKDKRFGGSILY